MTGIADAKNIYVVGAKILKIVIVVRDHNGWEMPMLHLTIPILHGKD